jgi:hypothetical protein
MWADQAGGNRDRVSATASAGLPEDRSAIPASIDRWTIAITSA